MSESHGVFVDSGAPKIEGWPFLWFPSMILKLAIALPFL